MASIEAIADGRMRRANLDDGLMKPFHGEAAYCRTVAEGYRRMTGFNVCICGLARDCAPALARTLPWLDKLCAQFKNAHVVIFENDSKDDSKELLTSWSAGRKHINLFLDDFGTATIPAAKSSTVNPSFSYFRIEKMAKYRNQYLDFASMLSGLNYLIVVDLDLYWIGLDGIAHAFGQDIPWDAQFANGRIMDPRRAGLGDFYWVTYAFLEVGDTSRQTETKLSNYWEMLKPLAKGMPLFAVQSAFGGVGVYRWEAIKGLRYGVEYNQKDPRIEVLVEHVYLHRQMIAAGHDRLFINPSLIVYYDKGPRSRTALYAELLVSSLRHHGLAGTARKLWRRIVKRFRSSYFPVQK